MVTRFDGRRLRDDSVDASAKILDDSINSDKLQSDSVVGPKIAIDAVTETKIQNDSVSFVKLKANVPGQIIGTLLDAFLVKTTNGGSGFDCGTGVSELFTDEIFQALKNISLSLMGYGGSSSNRGLIESPSNGFNRVNLELNASEEKVLNGVNKEIFSRVTVIETVKNGGLYTVTNGSTTVTTENAHNFSVGEYFSHSSDTQKRVGKVASIGATTFELEDNWQGDNIPGVSGGIEVELQISFFTKTAGVENAETMANQIVIFYLPTVMALNEIPFGVNLSGTISSENFPSVHTHDDRYYTETELSDTEGAALIGYHGNSVTAATNISDALDDMASTSAATPRFEQIPAEAVLKGNSFTNLLSFLPNDVDAVMVYFNGLLQTPGVGNDVTVTLEEPTAKINLLATADQDITVDDEVVVYYEGA